MAIELGVGYITVLPETSKILPGIKESLGLGEKESEESGRRSGKRYKKSFSQGMAGLAPAALAIGGAIAGVVASSVKLEKQFSQTMSVAAATLGAPQREMAKLQKLALDLGASTSFSANEAADAMLELAKGGLSAATIQGGALAGTLQLAAAGGTSLSTAAEIASNALNTFKLEGKDMADVSAALAGAANASTASVESLGQALGQVGPGAAQSGLSLQETVAALAAFDSAGVKGSDAGTSLKTMLQRLVPQTSKAATAMKKAGLDFTDAEGNFVSLTEISQQLQDGLAGLSESARTQALNDIFGSDASRAAAILMDEGAEGIGRYIKAAQNKDSAEEAAQARMAGTAGALERLSGAWETFRLQIGLAVAPAVQGVADVLGRVVGVLGNNLDILGPVTVALGVMALGIAAVVGVTWAWNAAMAANPIGLLIVGIAGLVAGLAFFFTKTEAGQAIVRTVWGGIKTAMGAVVNWWTGTAWPALRTAWEALASVAKWLYSNIIRPVFSAIAGAVRVAWTVIRVIFVTWATAWTLLWKAITWAWSKTGAPVFRKVQLGFRIMALALRVGWQQIIKPTWDAIVRGARSMWNWLDRWVFKPVALGFRVMGFALRAVWTNVVRPVWEGIKTGASRAWNWIRDKAFNPLKKALGPVGEAFKQARRIISAAWNQIKRATARPINFVIREVYMKGIKKTWDSIADKVGLKLSLPTIKEIGGFASGGVLPGYTPGRDVHDFYSPTAGRLRLSGGEAIMRPEFTRAVGGPAGVAALNAKARKGQAFKNGGVWGFAGDALDWVKDKTSLVANVIGDPVGALGKLLKKPLDAALSGIGGGVVGKVAAALPPKVVSALIDKVKGMVGGMASDLAGGGMPSGPALGWRNQWRLIKAAFPGAALHSAYRPGAITAVGTPSYHGQGRAVDVTPSMAIFNWIAKHFPNSRELIYSPANGRQIWNGRNYMFGEPTRGDHWDHVHWAMKNGGVWSGLFDQGGWLPDKGVGMNLTGQPEAVLTPRQSKALESGLIAAQAVAAGQQYASTATSRGRQKVTLAVGSREFEAYMTEIAEDAIDADNGFSNTTRRMG